MFTRFITISTTGQSCSTKQKCDCSTPLTTITHSLPGLPPFPSREKRCMAIDTAGML